MKIRFLLHNAYGIGGTITTTFNLAQGLAERHDVEIVSVLRHRQRTAYTLDPGVRLRPLVDLRAEQEHPLHLKPARVFPEAEYRYGQYSRLTDQRIEEWLDGTDADVVIATRPGLNVHLALQGPRRLLRIGQEHLTLDHHSPRLRGALRRAYPRLDALTTVTEADARAYRRKMHLPGVSLQCLPNSVPDPTLPVADSSSKTVIAAGRLVPVKRFDLMIEAFARVAAQRPDWRLRIYGKGEEHERLSELIERLGLHDNVLLMGAATPIEAEWVKGSIGLAASNFEPFGMTIVEAMRCGLPVVSTDCPHGPAEIIRDGVDGRLTPVGDADALAAALLDLINDDSLRRRMGQAAVRNAQRFSPTLVVRQAEQLIGSLRAPGTGEGPGALPGPGLYRVVTSRSHALKDGAHVAAGNALRRVRSSGR
ncbi:glycosyltransferase family 4 protein [Streptomyces sp. NPDC002588]|uniref:glycosyltransferase family 4 protein n=1 Tax=Streptomyces sp. NPDC002588 TaxID=3154419 RepID=UPI00331F0178